MTNKHRYRTCSTILVFALAATAALAAEANFSGTWKLNLQKSQLTGQTLTLEKTASGMMHYDSLGFAYDFNPDGKEYPLPDGSTLVVRPADANTWDYTLTMRGKVTMTLHSTLNGDSQTFVMHLNKPDGTAVEQTSTFTRVSGGPGPLGKWKSTEVKGSPTTVVIAMKGKNGVTVEYPEFQQVCKGRFDGKDHTVTQAGAASKFAIVFERTGADALKITTKLQGKPLFVDTLTLSADGNTLTDDGNGVSVNEPTKAIYERQ
jgi:hypothetical protein